MDNTSTIVLAVALGIIMLGMGLSLVTEDFKRIVVYPKAILIGLINQMILLPLIGFTIALVLSLPAAIAIGIMILAACPGGPTSNLISHLAKGDTALSVTLTALSSFITLLTIPLIVNFAIGHFGEEAELEKLPVLDTIKQIFFVVIIPVIIGMLIRHFREGFALRMGKPVRIASAIVLALVIIGIVLKDRANFVSYFQQAGIAALLLNASTMVVGYFTARLFRITDRRSISISIESGIQNGTMAIMVAFLLVANTTNPENAEFAIAPAIYSLIMFFTGGVVIWIGINRAKKSKPAG